MASINQTQGTSVPWTSSGGTEVLTLTSLANGAGRAGKLHDFEATFPEKVRCVLCLM